MHAPHLIALAAALGLVACAGAAPATRSAPAPAAAHVEPARPSDPSDASGIRWHHDDYPAARAAATALGKPLVLDLWAPWCHTCLSMKHTVLADPGMRSYAERFVWLTVDTDRPANEAVVQALPIHSWPTFFVLDPGDETVLARLQGGAPLPTFRAFLEQGEAAALARRSAAGRLAAQSPLHHLTLGDQLATRGDLPGAEAAYLRALELGGPTWQRRPDVLVATIALLYQRGAYEDCVAFGERHVAETTASRSSTAADCAFFTQHCGEKGALPPSRMRPALEGGLAAVREVLDAPDAALSADDRADAMRVARNLLVALDRAGEARGLAEQQRDFLDATAAAAATPREAMTYNWPRAEVYAWLGQPEALVPALRAQVAALPDQYDPAYRLAWLLHQATRDEEALPVARRALELAYGPRRARIQALIQELTE